MIDAVIRTIEDRQLLQPGDRVLVALSGGPDSVALAHVLHSVRHRYDLELATVYVNHQIRKRAAKQEERFCQALADRLGIELYLVTEDIPALATSAKKGIEETARTFRYGVFERLAQDDGYDKIAVGHHADDQAETVLFRVLRGTGRSGLLGIPVKRGKIIRPLLYVGRKDILAYLKDNGLEYCIDKSNLRNEYKRNFIRNRLLVTIRKHINPAVETALSNLAESSTAEDEYLNGLASRAFRKSVRQTVGGKLELDLDGYGRYDLWLRRRLLRLCLTQGLSADQPPDLTTIEQLDDACLIRRKAISLPGGISAVLVGNRMVLLRIRNSSVYAVSLKQGQKAALPGLRLHVRYRVSDSVPDRLDKKRRSNKVVVDAGKIRFPLTVRNIRPGDRFRPLGMRGGKKVGDYLTDRKVPLIYRDEIPVVCDKDGIVWLTGFEIAERVKVDGSTRKVARIESTKRRSDSVETV